MCIVCRRMAVWNVTMWLNVDDGGEKVAFLISKWIVCHNI